MKNIFVLKTFFPFLLFVFLFAAQASAQLTLTVTVTNATNCTAPCNGSAAANNVPGATYVWNTTPVQTTATATGLCPGTYSVTGSYMGLTAGGTGTVSCTPNGINNVSVNENIRLFPNPAHSELYIQVNTDQQGKVDLVLRNILGIVVYQEAIETNGHPYKWIDISALPAGIYDVECMDGNTLSRNKFVKQ